MTGPVSTVETALAKALREAGRSKPADCTCDGLHTASADRSMDWRDLVVIANEASCPAERRAMHRIATDRKAGLS